MSSASLAQDSLLDADLAPIVDRLNAVEEIVTRIADEVGPGTVLGAEVVIERRRPEVYAAMEAVGMAIHAFLQSPRSPEAVAVARGLVVGKLREISLTSPIALRGLDAKRSRISYFELVEHVRKGRATGADVPARVLDDYYVHTHIGRAFLNRLVLVNQRLVDEVARCHAAGDRPVHLISLQYIGGDDLLPLSSDANTLADLRVTCVDSSVAAVRHAERRLKPAFKNRIRCLKAEPERWLGDPACPSHSACIIYAASLLEQLPSNRVLRLLRNAHRVLRRGGVLLIGCTSGNVPVAERVIRDWLLGWDWKYRGEEEWRELFSQTPFDVDRLTFEYEPLGVNALVRAHKNH